ncbi:MAG: hypothetical protein ACRCXZ_03515 [Patescibacteria group bacterium]
MKQGTKATKKHNKTKFAIRMSLRGIPTAKELGIENIAEIKKKTTKIRIANPLTNFPNPKMDSNKAL